jgi:hypothetical protein
MNLMRSVDQLLASTVLKKIHRICVTLRSWISLICHQAVSITCKSHQLRLSKVADEMRQRRQFHAVPSPLTRTVHVRYGPIRFSSSTTRGTVRALVSYGNVATVLFLAPEIWVPVQHPVHEFYS